MLPGEVKTDQQAFLQILGRLESEVGTILQLIPVGKSMGLFPNTAPLWSLVRMTFPIAESMGDLIYRNKSTARNLKCVLETEFEAVRSGYRGKAAILALLFRHSLMHADELRMLLTRGREIRWALSWSDRENHLKVTRAAPTVCGIRFDTTAFYEDLVAVCRKAVGRNWGGEVARRYNGWLALNLDKKKPPAKDAIGEIANLCGQGPA